MKARLLLACALCLSSAPAHAHGGALLVVVAFAGAPVLILIFLPLCALSGMAGKRLIALGLYLAALVVAFALQWQDWYHPFARMFPEPTWLQQRLDGFVLIPPLDVLMWLVLAVVVIYLALRDRSVPIRLMLPPAGNLLWGSLFSVAAVALWIYVLFGPGVSSRIRIWPDEIRVPFTIVWVFIVPVVLTFIAIRLFRNGLRLGRNRARR